MRRDATSSRKLASGWRPSPGGPATFGTCRRSFATAIAGRASRWSATAPRVRRNLKNRSSLGGFSEIPTKNSIKRTKFLFPSPVQLTYYLGMKRISASQYLIFLLVLALSCFVAFAADEQTPTKTIKKVNAQPTASLTGPDLFKEYCAVCHGNDAKGSGPAEDALKKR